LRKLMMLGALLAMVLVAAAPAIAQIGTQDEDDEESSSTPVTQGFSQEDVESGDVEPAVDISNKGNNVNLCPTVLQGANTGNVQNEQGVTQYQDEVDDIEFEGSNITFETEAEGECVQTIEQTVAAAAPKAAPPPPPAPTPTPAPAPTAQAGGGGGAAAAAGVKTLPKTGGIADTAPLLGIGAGALLVAGGLLARRVMR
jgi:LPXTG-motif cell wall-anchored protein